MQEIRINISKEDYERLKELSRSELYREVESMLPKSILYGYGYYGCRGVTYDEECDKYFALCTIGSTCD